MNTNTTVSSIVSDINPIHLEEVQQAPQPKRKIQIVYSVDSAASMLAAVSVKRMIASIDPQSTAGRMYEFKVSEVTDIDRRDVYATWIWLDVSKLVEAKEGEHLVLTGNAVGHWSDSAFSEQVLNYVQSGGFVTRAMSDKDAPTPSHMEASTLQYGILINAILALSHAAPELEFENAEAAIAKLSSLQNDLSKFYSSTCKTRDLLRTFAIICHAQGELGHVAPSNLEMRVSDEPLYERIRKCDTVALTYYQLYTQARIRVMTQGVSQKVLIKADKRSKVNRQFEVLTVRIPDYFWLARRVIELNKKYYHNTRLVVYGLHSTTDLPSNASEVHQRMDETSTAL